MANLLIASPINAVIFDNDDRVQVSTAPGSIYSPIGIASGAPETRYATATLVDRCHVLTSQHIFGTRRSPLGQRLWFSEAPGSTPRLRSAGTVIAAGGMERFSRPEQDYEARARDWLLIRLDACLGSVLGSAELSIPANSAELDHVENAGFPVDKGLNHGLTVDPSCEVRSVWKLVWLHDCATRVGNSGGPIFRIVRDSPKPHLEVYAIESGGWPIGGIHSFNAEFANQATPVSQILPYIKQYLHNS